MKNDRGSPDLGRPRGRSNGHEKQTTWHAGWPATLYAFLSLDECNRLPINICSEVHFWTILLFPFVLKHLPSKYPLILCYLLQEDFLKDVMQFLLQRGHDRLVPQGGLAEFPDAVLNSKRLDLYNLYKEVVAHCCSHVSV